MNPEEGVCTWPQEVGKGKSQTPLTLARKHVGGNGEKKVEKCTLIGYWNKNGGNIIEIAHYRARTVTYWLLYHRMVLDTKSEQMNQLLTSLEGQVLSKPGASYKYYIIITASP